jgi:hypothetical protein
MGDSNPFATRFTRPGAIEYLFPAGQSAASLVAQLADQGWWGEIVGPHGSGKSTLVATLVPALREAGRRVAWRAIRTGREGEAPAEPRAARNSGRLQEIVAAKFADVVAGSDDWLGLPPLVQIKPSEAVTQQVVARLTADHGGSIAAADVSRIYAAAGGNVRETLFALYDVYQSRKK